MLLETGLARSSSSWRSRALRAAAGVLQTPAVDPSDRDPFFDDTVLHDIRLAINATRLESLQVNFLDNTYYPCNFTVARHRRCKQSASARAAPAAAAASSRGCASTSTATPPIRNSSG